MAFNEYQIKEIWKEVYYSEQYYSRFNSFEMTPLMAVESGSRAWGFESDDSDYDVRLVYRRPFEDYLSLNDWKDTTQATISFGDTTIDVAGWDIRKFLTLAKKGNAQPFEWLFSCPVYFPLDTYGPAVTIWLGSARKIVGQYLNPTQMAYHYRGMLTNHWHRYIEGRDAVTHKKYLYLIRAMAHMQWYLEHDEPGPQSMAPGNLLAVMDGVSDSGIPEIVPAYAYELIERKVLGDELGKAKPIPELDKAIGEYVERWSGGLGGVSGGLGWDLLNDFFRWTLEAT